MRSSFFGLEMGLRALTAQQKALDVTGHNIANAHTPGFSRQRLELSARPPLGSVSMNGSTGGFLGAGVEPGQAMRIRDTLIDHRYHTAAGRLSEWETRYDVMDQIQHIMAEPGELGIGGAFDQFWNSLQEVGNHPESIAARRSFVESAEALSDIVNQTHHNLNQVRSSLDEIVRVTVEEVNSLVSELAEVNTLIVQASVQGDFPNDLKDQRDLLLDKLSGLIDVTVQHEPRGDVTVFCGSHRIIDVSGGRHIGLEIDSGSDDIRLFWQDSDAEFITNSGKMNGLLVARDEYLPTIIGELETLMSEFIEQFNEIHNQGYGLDGETGRDFFVAGSSAGTMAVVPLITSEPHAVAASLSGEPGDNSNALTLARLRNEPLVNDTTIDDYYNAIISRIGTLVQRADGSVEANRNIKLQVEMRRESVSGVSLDEEVTHLLRYQHAYTAAARYVSVVDHLLDTVINHMGR